MCSARRRTAGFTFVELMITVAVLAVLGLVIERTLQSTREATNYLETVRRVQRACDRAAYDLYERVSSSRRLFLRGEVGNAYVTALDLTRNPPRNGVRLPRSDEVAPLGPDRAGEPRTGNMLLFVTESDPVACPADPTTGEIRYIDVYRFICCYPHMTDAPILSASGQNALDFVIWVSKGYPSYRQVMAIQDVGQREAVARQLSEAHGYAQLWDTSQSVGASFFPLNPGGLISAFPVVEPQIEEDLEESSGGCFVYADVQLAPTNASSRVRRTILSADDPATWVPDGFEVKVSGASGHRKVWMHIVAEGQSPTASEAAHAATLIASVRDL